MSFTTASLTRKLLILTVPPLRLNRFWRWLCLSGVVLVIGLALAWLPLRAAVAILAGAILLTLLLLRPIISLYLLIPVIPFSPLLAISVSGVRVGLMEMLLFGGVAVWLLQFSLGRDQQLSWPPLLWAFLLMLAGVSLSWLNALSLGASLIETLKWLEMLVLYWLVVALLPARHIKWAVLALLLTGLAQAGLGLYQFIFKAGPAGFLLFGGRFLRAYGTFAQPNPYAGYLGLVLPLALTVALWAWFDFGSTGRLHRSSRKSRLLRTALFSLPLAVMLAALLASQSRSAWLGFMSATVIVLALYNRKTAALLAAAIFAGAILLLLGTFETGLSQLDAVGGAALQRLVEAGSIFNITDISAIQVTDANFATVERLAHWQAAQEMWRDHLWLGVGFGNYAVVYPVYAIGRWLDPLGHAHNYFLNIGAETGLIGITAYLIFWILTFGVLWHTVRRSHGFNRAVAVGAVGIMVHLHVHNLFDNLFVQGMYLHVAIILALVSIIYQTNRTREK